jgi:hypothetical protein
MSRQWQMTGLIVVLAVFGRQKSCDRQIFESQSSKLVSQIKVPSNAASDTALHGNAPKLHIGDILRPPMS